MKFLLIIFCANCLLIELSCEEAGSNLNETASSFYTAAVVELNPPGDKFSDPHEIVDANLDEYLRLIDEASLKGVDILVFPEATLNYRGIKTRESLSDVAVNIVDPTEASDISECDYSHDVILSELSFAVANASIYVLVNVVEMEACNDSEICSDGFKLFNTNIVFDRNGCILSRYRKFNLFLEPNMNVTNEAEISTFETDFGVTFGHFVCFDILFKSPALEIINMNVTHILYPSMWYSETPFLTSTQIQQGYAQRNNIVLISAGGNSPSDSNTGSGIYVGKHGAIEKIISCRNETIMMIAEVPKDVNDPDFEPAEQSIAAYTPTEMEDLKLWNFTPTQSSPLSGKSSFLNENSVCGFHLNYTKLEIPEGHVGYGYRLAVYWKTRSYAGILNAGEIHCSIIACVDENDEKTCGERLEGQKLMPSVKFHSILVNLNVKDDPNILILPTTLDTSITPLKTDLYEFNHKIETGSHHFQMKLSEELNNLMTFGLYGRNFNLDSKTPEPNNENYTTEEPQHEEVDESVTEKNNEDNSISLKMTIYVLLMVVLSIITAIMTYKKLQHPYVKPNMNKRKS